MPESKTEPKTADRKPWDGFIPGVHCKRCGARLQGQGEGRPAESYAGTYTGLCNICMGAGVYVDRVFPDGAQLLNYPPHSPSWRRDRETFHAYPDCQHCRGTGFKTVSRSGPAFGGSYPSYCEPCLTKFCTHPVRKAVEGYQRRFFEWTSEENRRLEKLKASKKAAVRLTYETELAKARVKHARKDRAIKRLTAWARRKYQDVLEGVPPAVPFWVPDHLRRTP